MDASTKSSWILNLKKLSKESDVLTKKIFSQLTKEDEFQKEWSEFCGKRDISTIQMKKKIIGLKTIFLELKERLQYLNQQSSHSNFQRLLESFENKLTLFKLTMRSEFDTLEESELNLTKDINRVESHLDTWGDDANVEFNRTTEQIERNKEKQQKDIERKAIVGTLDRKIAAMGKNGGWDSRDHDSFMKVWNQIMDSNGKKDFETFLKDKIEPTNVEEFEALINSSLTTVQKNHLIKKLTINIACFSTDEIELHINWFLKFLYLNLCKKKVLSEWRKDIVNVKNKITEEVLITEILDNHDAKVQQNNTLTSPDMSNNEEKNLAIKERIVKWRLDRLKEKDEEKTKKLIMAAKEKKISEEEKLKRQATARQQLQQWKQSEEIVGEMDNKNSIPMENVQKIVIDPELIKKRQERDLLIGKTRFDKVDQVEKNKTLRSKKIKDMKTTFDLDAKRDPNRLVAPTHTSTANKVSLEDLDYAERKRTVINAHDSKVAFSGRDLKFSGRAVPAWCNPPKIN